jgi:nitroimidazol reductase NimA-like FMN-containing flavoprotein (pyridoxamine 5'-phosphate oxidase superfamily)
MAEFQPTARTTLRRIPKRGVFDSDQVYSILDEALICHAGFNDETGRPVVIPTAFGRDNDRILLHGSAASRMLREFSKRVPICVTVTLIDGLVLARSAFHHSINYRSVVILGEAEKIEEETQKNDALRIISEHLVPGRWSEARQPNPQELKATSVLSLDLNEVSAKVRTGGPNDDEEDLSLPVWAGVLPLRLTAGEPLPDGDQPVPPAYIANYRRTRH